MSFKFSPSRNGVGFGKDRIIPLIDMGISSDMLSSPHSCAEGIRRLAELMLVVVISGDNSTLFPPEARALLSRFDKTVKHYEIILQPD
jgi:hypothetical protein